MTTPAEIGEWFDRGVSQNATHMLVVCDTFDHDDYPVFATGDKDVLDKYAKYHGNNMQRVMEVYALQEPKAAQLSQAGVFRLPTSAT